MPRPPPPGCRLDDDRIADLTGEALGLARHPRSRRRSRDQRQAEGAGGALGLHLVAHGDDVLGLGPDPDDVVGLDDLGELRVFRQEAVARMDRVGVRDLGGRDDVRDVEVGFRGRGRPDAHRLVGEAHVHGVGIGGGMHRHGADAHFVAGAVDAQRDLAAIGDQHLFDLAGHRVIR
jgi:hypothetical protein